MQTQLGSWLHQYVEVACGYLSATCKHATNNKSAAIKATTDYALSATIVHALSPQCASNHGDSQSQQTSRPLSLVSCCSSRGGGGVWRGESPADPPVAANGTAPMPVCDDRALWFGGALCIKARGRLLKGQDKRLTLSTTCSTIASWWSPNLNQSRYPYTSDYKQKCDPRALMFAICLIYRTIRTPSRTEKSYDVGRPKYDDGGNPLHRPVQATRLTLTTKKGVTRTTRTTWGACLEGCPLHRPVLNWANWPLAGWWGHRRPTMTTRIPTRGGYRAMMQCKHIQVGYIYRFVYSGTFDNMHAWNIAYFDEHSAVWC